ncbi:MAG: phosphatidylglycerol lysyltransferase domain-containing protein [Clostridiales bacterium]|nr:phosphatidylglycerol lysyltransferase domain-containing protein [Clostridiales bacterium]
MQFRSITIEDKSLFQYYLADRYYETITYNFTSFYLWQYWDNYRFTENLGSLWVQCDLFGSVAFLPPIAPDEPTILAATEAMIDWFAKNDLPFFMVEGTEFHRQLYQNAWPNRFCYADFPLGDNYIYRVEDLVNLKGNKYRNKRNHIYQFLREYTNFQFLPLDKSLIQACRRLTDDWVNQHKPSHTIIAEYKGLQLLFDHYAELDCLGAGIIIDDKLEAFTIGEKLNRDTFMIQVEKANPAKQGIYQAINQFFLRDFAKDYTYVNRAEDMDEPGIRQAKQSYHPCKMAKKIHFTLAEDISAFA